MNEYPPPSLDIIRMKPIMEALPANSITYDQLRIIFSILEYEYGIRETDGSGSDRLPFKRKVPAWISSSNDDAETENVIYNTKKKCQSLFAAWSTFYIVCLYEGLRIHAFFVAIIFFSFLLQEG